MAKDAKGHGSEKRGGWIGNNNPEGKFNIAPPRTAADELSRGTPPSKAGPAPVHSGASGPSMADFVKNMQAGQREDSNVVRNRAGKRAYGSRWRSKDGTF